MVAISDPARAESFYRAFSSEFGYFPMGRRGEPPLPGGQRANWVGLFRWLFSSLAAWSVTVDPHAHTLGAAFILAQSVRGGSDVWASLPPSSVAANLPLLACLKAVVKSAAMTFGERDGAAAQIWEREALARFTVADAAGDWAAIGEAMSLFENQLAGGGVAVSQSILLLFRAGLEHLVAGTTSIHQTLVAMQATSVLPRTGKLSLAAASDNPYVQFACVYQAVARRADNPSLSSDEQAELSVALLKVAGDGGRWAGWMKVFSTYPVRYPALQKALGVALATAPEAALQAYVDAISLHPIQNRAQHGDGRRAVADCLRTFRDAAPLERRHFLWRLAYDRWAVWDFGGEDSGQHLFGIHWSNLDYAVVAFAMECLEPAERLREDQRIRLALQDLDLQWFGSISDVHTAWYRLLSRIQPYAHAAHVAAGEDWLNDATIYWAFDPAANPYIRAKFAV